MNRLPYALVLLGLAACTGDKDTATDSEPALDCSTRDFGLPTARGDIAGVWDADRERLVFFGGDQGPTVDCYPQADFLGETWAFYTDCDNFEQLDTSTAPSPRSRHAVTLDAARGRMLLQGGRYRSGTSGPYTLNDELWAFDLATDTWSQLQPTNQGPSARINQGLAVAGDLLVVYGGNTSGDALSYRPAKDLWTLDLNTLSWTKISDAADPGDRLFHSMIASDDGSKIWVYGGGDERAYTGPLFGDLWELDVSSMTWEKIHGERSGAPGGRIWANLGHDSANNRLVLFGGHNAEDVTGPTNELWEFDLGARSWNNILEGDIYNPDSVNTGFCEFAADYVVVDEASPERRYANVGGFNDEGLVIFGGKTDCGMVNDAWSWSYADGAWTERSPATQGEVCLRAFSEGCESLCF